MNNSNLPAIEPIQNLLSETPENVYHALFNARGITNKLRVKIVERCLYDNKVIMNNASDPKTRNSFIDKAVNNIISLHKKILARDSEPE